MFDAVIGNHTHTHGEPCISYLGVLAVADLVIDLLDHLKKKNKYKIRVQEYLWRREHGEIEASRLLFSPADWL